MTAPRLDIDLSRITENAHLLVDRLGLKGISVTGITKAMCGSPELATAMARGGVGTLGDARVENIEALRAGGVATPITLIRSPMLSQVHRVVIAAAVSLNSEAVVIEALSVAAVTQSRTHGIVLMVELGDLREGVLASDLLDLARLTLRLPGLTLLGLGTNLACQSGVVPDETNMAELSRLVELVETTFDVVLPVVSGGNSANLNWAFDCDDLGRVNELRLGESILLGREPLHRTPIHGLHLDAFTLVAEIVESKDKPSQPWGTIGQAAFGTPPTRSGSGTTRQSLLALGRQDVDPEGLTAAPGFTILGASSDHLVVDTGDTRCSVGSELTFQVNYSALVRAMTSPFVTKVFHGDGP